MSTNLERNGTATHDARTCLCLHPADESCRTAISRSVGALLLRPPRSMWATCGGRSSSSAIRCVRTDFCLSKIGDFAAGT